MSPVVERNTTTSNRARPLADMIEAFLVSVTEKPSASPMSVIASMPSPMDPWRNPCVSWKIRTSKSSAALAGSAGAAIVTKAAHATTAARRALICGVSLGPHPHTISLIVPEPRVRDALWVVGNPGFRTRYGWWGTQGSGRSRRGRRTATSGPRSRPRGTGPRR